MLENTLINFSLTIFSNLETIKKAKKVITMTRSNDDIPMIWLIYSPPILLTEITTDIIVAGPANREIQVGVHLYHRSQN